MSELKSPAELAEEIRQVFASGNRVFGEQLLLTALDAGLAWDAATRAAAQGEALHRAEISARLRRDGGSFASA
jgi:hypothetical protein